MTAGAARAGRIVGVFVDGKHVCGAPFGFGEHYTQTWKDPAKPEELRDLLELVGWTADPAAIATWPMLKRVEAEVYAARSYLRASDNVLRVPKRPRWKGGVAESAHLGELQLWSTPAPTVLP